MKDYIIISAILFNLITAGAATKDIESDEGMTLNDCLIYAHEHAYVNRLNRYAEEKAKTDCRLIAGDLMPYVNLSSSGNLSFGRNIDPETNLYDNNETLYTGFGLSLSLPLFDGLVNINSLRSARIAVQRLSKRTKVHEDELSLEIIRQFYNISYCKAMVGQMEEQLKRDENDLKLTVKGEELGTKSGADVSEMKAVVAADEYDLTNQRNLLAKAYLQLRSLMGMTLNDEPLNLIEKEEEDRIVIECNPKIEEAALALKECEYSLKMAKGAIAPKIYLNGGINTSYFKMMGMNGNENPRFSKQWKNNMGEYIGITFSLPIFDGLSSLNRIKKAKIELKSKATEFEQIKYEIEKLKVQASLDLKASRDEFTAADKRLEAEEAASKAVRRKYELGSASVLDLYSSGAKLATARANLEGKRIQLKICEITLGYYSGQKLIRE